MGTDTELNGTTSELISAPLQPKKRRMCVHALPSMFGAKCTAGPRWPTVNCIWCERPHLTKLGPKHILIVRSQDRLPWDGVVAHQSRGHRCLVNSEITDDQSLSFTEKTTVLNRLVTIFQRLNVAGSQLGDSLRHSASNWAATQRLRLLTQETPSKRHG
jgi:hypothetical protein